MNLMEVYLLDKNCSHKSQERPLYLGLWVTALQNHVLRLFNSPPVWQSWSKSHILKILLEDLLST